MNRVDKLAIKYLLENRKHYGSHRNINRTIKQIVQLK